MGKRQRSRKQSIQHIRRRAGREDSAGLTRRGRLTGSNLLPARIALGALLLGIQLVACHLTPRHDSTGVDECDDYLASLEHCTGRSNPLIKSARESLRENFDRAHGDEGTLASLASQCSAGRHTLEEACR